MISVRFLCLMMGALFATSGSYAADQTPARVSPQTLGPTLFHTGGSYPQPRGDAYVGAEAAGRDSLLPNLTGDAAFYDDAPRCSLYQTRVFFGHRFTRWCR